MGGSRLGSRLGGGLGGVLFDGYQIPGDARLREVEVTSGWYIDSLRLLYSGPDGEIHGLALLGGQGGERHQFRLGEGEWLMGISGRCGIYIASLRFHTNWRVSPTYGGPGGDREYLFWAPEGGEVVGFWGRADWYLDAIGILVRPALGGGVGQNVGQAPGVAAQQEPDSGNSRNSSALTPVGPRLTR